jgi:hypothetical protein
MGVESELTALKSFSDDQPFGRRGRGRATLAAAILMVVREDEYIECELDENILGSKKAEENVPL